MASRKKGKKTKGQTIALTEFLVGVPTIPMKSTSWADDVDDEHEGSYMSKSNKEPVVLPTAPRAARGPGVDEENIPNNPPFVAYVSNLPYDILEEDLADFFQDMSISNMRLPKDSSKPKGYGYVEFEDRQSLIDALSMSNTMIKTRRVRIEVSNSSNDDRRGGRMGMGRDGNRRDGYDDPDRTSGDWRSRPKEEPSGMDDRFRSRGGFENRDRQENRETSESDNKPGAWREGERNISSFGERRGGGGGYRDDERRGGFRSDDRRGGGGFRDDERRGGGGFRDEERRGGGGFRDEERRGGGGFRDDERRGGGGYRNDDREKTLDWSRDRSGSSFAPQRDAPSREDAPPSEPRERPRLNLQPRTKPVEPIMAKEEQPEEEPVKKEVKKPAPAPTPPVRAADIFGAAKPVDTTAREREIEERLAKSNAEKPKTEESTEGKGAWGRRNGEGRSDREKERPRPAWRSDEDRGRQAERHERHERRPDNRSGRADNRGDSRADSRGPPNSRQEMGNSRSGGRGNDRGPPERERRERERDRDGYKDDPPMPKATDEPAPNFVASNKFSMLPEDVDPDVDA